MEDSHKEKMKYFKWNSATQSFSLDHMDKPIPKEGQNLMKVAATCINHVDIGASKRKPEIQPPILGVEFVGHKQSGDQLYGGLCRGSFCEYTVVGEKGLLDLSSVASLEAAAALPESMITAYQLLAYIGPNLSEESVVYVVGASSGVGMSAVQLLKQLWGCKVLAIAGTPEKVEKVKQLGADFVWNYKELSENELTSKILESTDGKGVDLVLDSLGAGRAMFHLSIIAQDGHWILYGLLENSSEVKLDQFFPQLLYKRVSLHTTTLAARSDSYKEKLVSDLREALGDKLEKGSMRVDVVEKIDIDFTEEGAKKLTDAFKKFGDRKVNGRMVITFS